MPNSASTDWPRTGRAGRAGDPPTHAQARAIFFVYQMGSGPVGDGCTRAEIQERVPELTLDELNDCLRAEWLKVDWWGVIGGEIPADAIPDCWDVLPDGVAFLRAEQAKRLPEHDHQWAETMTKERFDPPWEACAICSAWREGPSAPARGPDLWHQLHEVYG